MAKIAKLSPSHFCRVFKSEMGITPYQYYQKLKIEHLMEKLNDTTISIKEAFKSCGLKYSGQSFAAFKKHVGVTPSQYILVHAADIKLFDFVMLLNGFDRHPNIRHSNALPLEDFSDQIHQPALLDLQIPEYIIFADY